MLRLASRASRKALCACALCGAQFESVARHHFGGRERVWSAFKRCERSPLLRIVSIALEGVKGGAASAAAGGDEIGAEFGAAGRHCFFLSVSGVEHREDSMQHD